MTKRQRRTQKKQQRRVKCLPVETILLRRGAISNEEYDIWHPRLVNLWRRNHRVRYPKDTENTTEYLQSIFFRSQQLWNEQQEVNP